MAVIGPIVQLWEISQGIAQVLDLSAIQNKVSRTQRGKGEEICG